MRTRVAAVAMLLGLASGPAFAQEKPPAIVVYPILVQAPVYGAKVDIPSIPGGGGGGSEGGSSSTEWGFNAAYMGGLELQGSRVFGEADLLWTKPSASRDITPRIDINTNLLSVTMKGGVRLFKGIGVTGGARYVKLDLDASIEFPNSGVTLTGSPSWDKWLPFVGGDWRGLVARKWTANASADFGLGNENNATRFKARLDWQPISHLSLRVGYQLLRLKLDTDATLGPVSRHWETTQTLHGPEFGLGFVF